MRALGISCVSGAGVELPLTLLSSTHPMQNATGTTILCQVNRLGGFLFAMQKQACSSCAATKPRALKQKTRLVGIFAVGVISGSIFGIVVLVRKLLF